MPETTKQKFLADLDLALEDIPEHALMEVLLDAYRDKLKRIQELEGENAHERQRLFDERESLRQEQHRMRRDPLYCAHGTYFMLCNNRKFRIDIHGQNFSMFERIDQYDFVAMQLPQEEWMKLKCPK